MIQQPLPFTRFFFLARTDAPLQLPDYAGSMLRGAFGQTLRHSTLLPHPDNQPCALKDNCPYCQIFLSPALKNHTLQKFSAMPSPYVIEPPSGERSLQKHDTFSFSVVLIGNALNYFPLVLFAFKRALEAGLGKHKTPCTLLHVSQQGYAKPLWQAGDKDAAPIAPLATEATPVLPLATTANLQFNTPLRLTFHHHQEKRNKLVRKAELDARTLLLSLARRYQLLCDVHLGAASPQQDFNALQQAASQIQLEQISLRWFDWGRYSTRQQQSMKLGGLVGELALHGDLSMFQQLLHMGQCLHVGKETTFGLGGYQLY